MSWNIVTRPVGVISFIHYKTQAALHEEYLGRPLRGLWHKFSSRNPALKDLNLKDLSLSKIAVTKAKPEPEKGGRAITFQLYDQEGKLVTEQTLHSGEIYDLDADIGVKYE
jgi:hypothetical protein